MDFNSNKPHGKPKHISRLTKEMHEFRLKNNPFSSPPSSTGSHDTVSTTTEELTRNLSNFSFSPDDEGTRKFSEDLKNPSRKPPRSGRFGASAQQPATMVNTSAIAHTFPEWSNLVNNKNTFTFTESLDVAASFKPVSKERQKENMPPTADNTDTFEDVLDAKRKRFRPEMQPRVDDESDCSTVLSQTTNQPVQGSRRSRFVNAQLDTAMSSPDTPKRSLQDMVSKIRTEKQTKHQESAHDTTPKQSPPKGALQQSHHDFRSSLGADGTDIGPTGRSFFLPAFRHLPDWTSGTLKFSSMRNGVPVFVKAGKTSVRLGPESAHESVNAVSIPEEDEEIFVSMDKLQEEVRELHDHDAMLQREAEKLQREVNQLQSELKRLKTRKRSGDSAIGSDSDGSFRRSAQSNQELEEQVAELRGRLDQATRQVGVNDIHSSALTAERDEALRQASAARERAKKVQAELENVQRELESTLQSQQDKETMELEYTALLTTNENLKQQHDLAVRQRKKLAAECDSLRQELTTVRKELATTKEELSSTLKRCKTLEEEKKVLSQDHASMERNNETYFKENKKLKAQIAARDQHIDDLKKGISKRDEMIDNIQGITTDTAVIELNAELEAEIEHLRRQLEKQSRGLQEKESSTSSKDAKIRELKQENLELACETERLEEENQRLRADFKEMEDQWITDRHKVVQLSQQLTKNNTEYLRSLNDNTDDCVRLEEDFRQKENTLRVKLDRREAAIRKVKQLTNKITEISQRELLNGPKPAKVTRIVEPPNDYTGKSDVMNVDEDPTTELHLTQGSDFASIMDDEIAKLKQTYRDFEAQAQAQSQQVDDNTEQGAAGGNTFQITDYDLPPLPSTNQSRQPTGILKKSSQFALDEDTGRFSVKSALSIVSHHSEDETNRTGLSVHSNRSGKSLTNNTQGKAPLRPESRLRRNSDMAARVLTEPTATVEQNMTSAFFVPDITLHSTKEVTDTGGKQSIASLSAEARRILDGLSTHSCSNCHVCIRIAANGDRRTAVAATGKFVISAEDARKGKKTVSVEKPVPVSERMPAGEEDATLRPATSPGEALAIVIKETQDEIDHLQMSLKRLNEQYFGLDKSLGQRERRRLMGEIKRLQAEVESKSGVLYRLFDVLEGQKVAGQMMDVEEVDVTVLSGIMKMDGPGVGIGTTSVVGIASCSHHKRKTATTGGGEERKSSGIRSSAGVSSSRDRDAQTHNATGTTNGTEGSSWNGFD
ncbi:hypothetical protein V8F33_000050 [Rhypophila sp. PSN 637]